MAPKKEAGTAGGSAGGAWSEQEKVGRLSHQSRFELTSAQQVEYLVRLLYANGSAPKLKDVQPPNGRSLYAAQHLMRKLKDEFIGKGGDSEGDAAGAPESPKKATPRKRKADGGAKTSTPKKTKKAKKSTEDVEDDEVDAGEGVKVENAGDEIEC